MTDGEYAAAIVPFAERTLERCIDAASKLKFDKKHAKHLLVVCLYGSIVEMATEMVDLGKQRRGTGVPVLLRSILEAFARMRCCIADPHHPKLMHASFLKEKLRPLNEALKNPDNEFLKSLAQEFDLKNEIAKLEGELAALKTEGAAPVTAFDEFEKAKMEKEYRSVYWILCLDTHTGISALENRHLIKRDGDYEVQWFKEAEAREVVRDFDSLCGLLVGATREVHEFLETEAVKEAAMLHADLTELRATRVASRTAK